MIKNEEAGMRVFVHDRGIDYECRFIGWTYQKNTLLAVVAMDTISVGEIKVYNPTESDMRFSGY